MRKIKLLFLIVLLVFGCFNTTYADEVSSMEEMNGDAGIEGIDGTVTFYYYIANDLAGKKMQIIIKNENTGKYETIVSTDYKEKPGTYVFEAGTYSVESIFFDGKDYIEYDYSSVNEPFEVIAGENIDIPIRAIEKKEIYEADNIPVKLNVLGNCDDFQIDIMFKSENLEAVYYDNKEPQKAYSGGTIMNTGLEVPLSTGEWQITAIGAWEEKTNRPLDIYYKKDTFNINSKENEITLYIYNPAEKLSDSEIEFLSDFAKKDALNMVPKTEVIQWQSENLASEDAKNNYDNLIYLIQMNYDMETQMFDGTTDVSDLLNDNEVYILNPQKEPEENDLSAIIPILIVVALMGGLFMYRYFKKKKDALTGED